MNLCLVDKNAKTLSRTLWELGERSELLQAPPTFEFAPNPSALSPKHFSSPPSPPLPPATIRPQPLRKMNKKAAIPDAWDDDWESQADKADAEVENANGEEQVKVSKAERLAKHAETNKKIWESAYVYSSGLVLAWKHFLILFQRNPRNIPLPRCERQCPPQDRIQARPQSSQSQTRCAEGRSRNWAS